MAKHLLKLVWNRRRTNILIVIEIFFSFLVLFVAVTLGAYYAHNYRQPLGFSYENVWNIAVGSLLELNFDRDRDALGARANITKRLLATLRDFPEVDAAAAMPEPIFDISKSTQTVHYKGRRVGATVNAVTDTFKDVMGLELVRGRWFESGDDALSWDPVVINQRLAQELFGSEDPLGKNIAPPDEGRESRVVGIITEFREDGELAGLDNYMFTRKKLTGVADDFAHYIVVKVRPSTPTAFQEKLMARLRAVGRDFSYEIKPLPQIRKSFLRISMAPLIAVGIVAAFLMIMVGLGLVGVVWQNVTQRTTEIGLRRALGGTAGSIYGQILGELIVITSIGLLIGTIVVAQLPMLGVASFLSINVYLTGLGMSLALIYLLTVLCGLYPSMLATKIQPAEALHYE